jgi:hypothetical protein
MSSSEVIAVAAVSISLLSVGAAFLTFHISVSAERRARTPALVICRAGSVGGDDYGATPRSGYTRSRTSAVSVISHLEGT